MPNKQTSKRSICDFLLSPARMLGSEWHWTGPNQIIVWYWTAPVHFRPDRSFSTCNNAWTALTAAFILELHQAAILHQHAN